MSTEPGSRAPADPGRERWALGAVLALALVARIVGVFLWKSAYFGDQEEYLAGAQRILDGLPLAHRNVMFFVRAPGYSSFIALVWTLTGGTSTLAVRLVQAALGTATCWFVFRLAQLVTSDRRAQWLSLLAVSFYPYLVYQCSYLGTESLFGFLVASSAYYLVRGLGRDRVSVPLVLGGAVLLSLSNLVRPNLSMTLPPAGLWLLYRYRRRLGDAFKVAAAVLAPVVLLALPWTLSIHRQGLGWIWITDGAGVWYWMGHQDLALKHYGCRSTSAEDVDAAERWAFNKSPTHDRARSMPDRPQEAYWQDAFAWDRQHRGDLPCITAGKVYGYWRPWVSTLHYGKGQFLASITSLPVLVFGLWGLGRARARGERLVSSWALLNMAAGTLTAAIFSTEVRYRIPIVDVLLLPFFGVGALALWARLRARRGASG